MPSSSPAQAKLMRAVAHGWHKPDGGGPPVSVAKEFVAADKRKALAKVLKKPPQKPVPAPLPGGVRG